MEIIRSRAVLTRLIKDAIDDGDIFEPFIFCEGLGKKSYKITIQLENQNEFVDENGDVWVRKFIDDDM